MKKKVTIEITWCHECPHRFQGYDVVCHNPDLQRSSKGIELKNGEPFPDWCPLENVSNENDH